MLRQMALATRFAADEDRTLLRAYLPAIAAHNLAQATELALHEGSATAAAASGSAPTEAPATGIAGKLQRKISLSFPRDTLEKAVEMWSSEAGVKAVILGSDLQLDGITKNQSFKLEERDQPAEAILCRILKEASPDGKLVYVLKPDGDEVVVQITTIAAATKRGDALPPGFAAPAAPKKK
jgi:hypothetical protein